MFTPDRASEQEKVTVTFALFQPNTFGAGDREYVIVGGVMSNFTVMDEELDSPTPFVAVQVKVVPEVSTLWVTAPQPDEDAMPDSGSDALQTTVTGELFQPLELGLGFSVWVITGGVVSTGMITTGKVTDIVIPSHVASTSIV